MSRPARSGLGVLAAAALAACAPGPAPSADETDAAPLEADVALRDRVVDMMRLAWGGYVEHAWGRDEVHPVSGTASDWHAVPLGLTAVDALDTLHLMGLTAERDAAAGWLRDELDPTADITVSAFETNIRVLGGLLSGHALLDDPALLAQAVRLGDALLPAFDSPTGMPYRSVNLSTGAVSQPRTSAADAGTWLLELAYLSAQTGDPRYEAAARGALDALDALVPANDLPFTEVDVEQGRITLPLAQVGGGVDSWLEYLFKGSLQLGDATLRSRWERMLAAANSALAEETDDGLWYGYADLESGVLNAPVTGALACFWPGLLALAGDLERGARHTDACVAAREAYGLLPDAFLYRDLTVVSANHELRPELAESLFVMWRLTGDPRWRARGVDLLDALDALARVEGGYTVLTDVRTGARGDATPSFFFAETLKYLFLLYADGDVLPLDAWVFNTEAHPLPIRR